MASALTSTTIKGVTLAQKVNRTASKSAPRLVCRASLQDDVKKAASFAVAAPALLAAHPAAAAIVEERLNGDGVGLALGFSDFGVAFGFLITLALVWSQFSGAGDQLGGGDGDDSGMAL